MPKKRLALLFGGKSEEHDVSIMSCASVLSHIDSDRYAVHVLGITKGGEFRYMDTPKQSDFAELKQGLLKGRAMTLSEVVHFFEDQVDVVFPILHGPFGEDGTLQGFMEIINMPYVGAGVSASVLCMDKAYMKTVLMAAGIPMTPFEIVELQQDRLEAAAQIMKTLSFPLFVKPANLGSSVGISKAKTEIELLEAIEKAFQYDRKIIVEQGVHCREIECGVLGNNPYAVSAVGEIIASHEFYDYDSKYFDEGRSQMIVPAKISDEQANAIKAYSLQVAERLGVEGLSRIDFFIDLNTDQVLFNEINTMPGFTAFSMYPSLFKESGLAYTDLIDRLVDLALERSTLKAAVNQ
jgi:D-alanine-D-alanine ligase